MKFNSVQEIQDLELEICSNIQPSSTNLIKQTFLVWHSLTLSCDNNEENALKSVLERNIGLMNTLYEDNSDVLFIRGWMISITPWDFGLNESTLGVKYLEMAYKLQPENLLFKWAATDSQRRSSVENYNLERDALIGISGYYINYLPIQDYFKSMLC